MTSALPVTGRAPSWVGELLAQARSVGEDVDAGLDLARKYGTQLPLPATDTALRWHVLAELGRAGLTAARIVEAHTDALAIIAECGGPVTGGEQTWGVFAAEAPGTSLVATTDSDGTRLTGVKPWCSLGDRLDAALVTALDGEQRRLFAVELQRPDVHAEPAELWMARGLRTVTSGPVRFDGTPARPVGEPGWYLHRTGFAWGGIGVAACWFGGALGLIDQLHAAVRRRRRSLDALYLGAVDTALFGARSALDAAAAQIDAGDVDHPELLALRTRAVVAQAVEEVLRVVGHALGPAPLAFDADYAARVADLTIYVRQHHGERDLESLGAALLDESTG